MYKTLHIVALSMQKTLKMTLEILSVRNTEVAIPVILLMALEQKKLRLCQEDVNPLKNQVGSKDLPKLLSIVKRCVWNV